MSDFQLTDEQAHARELFLAGDSLAIEAGAGTGKTSTLVALAEARPGDFGQYVAFNKAIVVESSGKFPQWVNCSTAHSLAWRAIMDPWRKRRINSSVRMPSWDKAKVLGLTSLTLGDKTLRDSQLAGIVMRAVERFCQSADPEPTSRHVPYVDGIDEPDETGRRTFGYNRQLADYLAPYVRKAWADVTTPDGSLPYDHAYYLKEWQLSGPKIETDYILFDEAQDANPVMVAIVAEQTHAQLVWVGDSQQQIYGFTGAINALANVPADRRAFLTQSFRFGPAIADVANVVLDSLGAELRLRGYEPIDSEVGAVPEPDTILARTNATAIRSLLDAQRLGKRVHLVGGGKEILSFARAAEKLMQGRRVEHPDLACFADWGEVRDYVRNDEQGDELRLMVTLVDDFGTGSIIRALSDTAKEKDADLIVSTAHKAKGREWRRVQLAGDFPNEPKDEELRLLYVAATRAQHRLDNTLVPYFNPEIRRGRDASAAMH